MAEVVIRNDDGSTTPAVPLGWQGSGFDWEVYQNEKPKRAEMYEEDVLCAVVTARTRLGLWLRMWRAESLFRGVESGGER